MTIGPKIEGVLYHYTSHDSLYKIVESRTVRASNVYYMNDQNEIRYAIDLFLQITGQYKNTKKSPLRSMLVRQISTWLKQLRITPHYIFVFSLSEKGNLLSQWRAYTSHGTGVSIGFNVEDVKIYAKHNKLSLVKCIYNFEEQKNSLENLLVEIIDKLESNGMTKEMCKGPDGQQLYPFLNNQKSLLLHEFVKIKDPAFHEECEWRLVSKYYEKYVDPDIHFRSGNTTLVPYTNFDLNGLRTDGRLFEQIFVGPSPNFNLAFSAISAFLSNSNACSMTINSEQPYREV